MLLQTDLLRVEGVGEIIIFFLNWSCLKGGKPKVGSLEVIIIRVAGHDEWNFD